MNEAQRSMQACLEALGLQDDPEMALSAERFVELLAGFRPQDDEELRASMSLLATHGHEGPVLVRELPYHTMCAHHLVPFFGTVDVGYLPSSRLVGLGSIGRVVQHFARRPQVQERLANQVAETLHEVLWPQGVAVRVRARQMCMEMRGAGTPATVEVIATRGTQGSRVLELLGTSSPT